jgi:uncharacterized membrane protein YphA (DoxX/SURF4 family)
MHADAMDSNQQARTVQTLRWAMAAILVIYGLAKIIGPQFKYDWQEFTFRHDDPNAYKNVFYFFGYSRVYGTFIALGELVPAALLLMPRTATIGAAAVFAIMLNITVMDWTYGLPLGAQLVATGLCVAAAYLLWTDRQKLAPLFAE